MVEEYVTRYRIPVSVKMEGEVPEGFYATTPSVDPPMIAISGPKSLVEKIVRAEAVLDLTTLPAQEGNVRTAVRISLQNSDGEPVESRLVEMTSESVLLDSVVLEQTIYSQRTIPVSELALTTGTPARGYEVKQVTVTPSTIVAAGKAENLDVLDALYPSSYVSVNDAVQSFSQRVAVRKPSELAYLSADSITVAVEIAPIITEKAYERQKVTVANLPDGFKATMVTNRANVTVAGSMLWVEGLRSADLTLTVDASGLPAGSYELPVLCAIKDSEGQTYTVSMEPAFIQVDIVEK
jgi:YbbR domain-containing protein